MPISVYSPPSLLLKLKLFVLSVKLFVVIALGLTAAVAAVAVLGCLSTVVMAILGFFGLDQATADTVKATVKGHHWERTIEISERVRVKDEDWCADVPSEARVLRREERTRSEERSGSRTKEIVAEWCTYEALEWRRGPVRKLEGDDKAPRWPDFEADSCMEVGCQREASRRQTLSLRFKPKGDKDNDCVVSDEAAWRRMDTGDAITVYRGGITGMYTCRDL